jgi:serine/threonine protein kinase
MHVFDPASIDLLYAAIKIQGSSGYWLPEVLDRKEFNPRQADVWALGVCLCIMLTSRLPFGDNESEAATRMRRGFDIGGGGAGSGQSSSVRLCPAAIDLLRGLLHYVPEVSAW